MVNVRFSYSASASVCLAPLEARESLLLIVEYSETMARSMLLTTAKDDQPTIVHVTLIMAAKSGDLSFIHQSTLLYDTIL